VVFKWLSKTEIKDCYYNPHPTPIPNGKLVPRRVEKSDMEWNFLSEETMTWPNLDPLTFAISPSSSRFKLFSVEKHDASGVLQTEFFPLIICFLCLSHFILLDVNECAASSSSCSSNALCTNNVGSYSCSCKAGFTGNGKYCIGVYII